MLLGEALIKAKVITQDHLQKALNVQAGNPSLSLGEILVKLFSIRRDVVESHYLSIYIIPFITEWFREQMETKEFSPGVPLSSVIDEVSIDVPFFTRHQAETVSFNRADDGMYRESSFMMRMEKILVTVDPLVITTKKQQEIIFNNVNLEVNLEEKGVHSENPGFLSEVKVRLLKSVKEMV